MSVTMALQSLIKSPTLDDEQEYLEEWTNSSRLLFYSVISISLLTLPILLLTFCYILCRSKRNAHFLPYLCSILAANFVLLSTIFLSVLAKNTDLVYDTIPGFLVCKISTFLVNSSSCFIYWTWVAMFAERCCNIFFPLRFRTSSSFKTAGVLCSILIFSMSIQLWTPIFITEKRLDNHMDYIYCGEDPRYSSQTRIIIVLECLTTFFLPLILTIFADISVLTWKSSFGIDIDLVSREKISGKNSETMKIVSTNSLKNSKKRRSNAIRQCLISSTITLFLNLPNYSLQLLDEFLNFRDSNSIQARRIFLRIDAFVYVLYLMQFPITPLRMFTLSKSHTRRGSRHRRNTLIA
ncbi:G-protein coupled receptors family 1 profile domain-containing protein [Caenorhabditis elegans]|uniref:G-protein coupled receptors family 1 profile domain-containing protein n=1 Tax=Caenorhabditis elegans TaxID=6239 RepID=O16474_CAEEL|nr:G-protein coupled receptors family 1 profile domain-containing protein [Caenorhabditis elegans]CCD67810.1 G-protein coupled receptors family 1 profile domain-containing protein [Caenorhabditis elegans]|eukprot:NP_503838.2 Uncharacterized protein CELE_C50H11.13 [Caenorhabditis elegans]